MYYVLSRNGEFKIKWCPEGADPLYGEGSWDLASGPFVNRSTAQLSVLALTITRQLMADNELDSEQAEARWDDFTSAIR